MSIQLTVMSLDFETDVAPSTATYDKREITLGRGPKNDVVLNLPEVSGEHAVLIAKEDKDSGEPTLFIKDLGSSNGTLVENAYIQSKVETPITPNQRIKIGRFLIKPFLNKDEFRIEKIEKEDIKEEIVAAVSGAEEPFVSSTLIQSAQETKVEDSSQEKHPESTEQNVLDAKKSKTNGKAIGTNGSSLASNGFHDTKHEKKLETVINPAGLATLGESELQGNVIEDLSDLDFVALQIFALRGSVTHQGKPVAGAQIDGGELGSTVSDEDGNFVFENVPETTEYKIRVSKERFRFANAECSGVVDDETAISFEAERLCTIRGRITHRGEALGGVEVDGGAVLGKTTTDGEGYYQFNDVPENTKYTLKAIKDGFLFGTRS